MGWQGLDHGDAGGTRYTGKPVATARNMALMGVFSSLLATGTQRATLAGPSLLYLPVPARGERRLQWRVHTLYVTQQ